MSCFPCFSSQKSKKGGEDGNNDAPDNKRKGAGDDLTAANISSQAFTFRELATATNNFRQECLLGEGGFGRVYKGTIQKTGQVVAVKQLDRNGLHGNKDFLTEVANLSLLQHPNLVKLAGYCADGDQRLLVYEFITGGTLEHHLFGDEKSSIDWQTRMKIASGAASGLEYLHDTASPPVIYRDFKSSNVLIDDEFNPKLTDFGLAKLGSNGDPKFALPSRVMGTYGYSAPEYVRSGELTLKSDVYSFGVVLLELITGRRAIDTTKPNSEQNLVTWAQPLFKDPKNYPDLADPNLNGRIPEKGLNQAVAIASMCLQEEASVRPLIADIAPALSFLASTSSDVIITPPVPLPSPSSYKHETDNDDEDAGSDYTENGSDYTDEEESEEYEDEEGSETSGSRSQDLSSRKSGRKSRRASKRHSMIRKVSNGVSGRKSSSVSKRRIHDDGGEVSMDRHGSWKPEDVRNSSTQKHLLEGRHSSSRQSSSRSRESEDVNGDARRKKSGCGSRKQRSKVSDKSSRGREGNEYDSIRDRSSAGTYHGSERSSSE